MYKTILVFMACYVSAQEKWDQWVYRDVFANEYFVHNNTLSKESTDLERWEYKNLNFGSIYSLDAKNPFQILIVYKDVHTVVVLDNFLNEIKKIDFLNDYNAFLIDFVGTAAGNKLWIKEKNINAFYLFDLNTKQFTSLNRPFEQVLKNIVTDFNFLYFINDKNQLFRLNIFGNVTQLHLFEKQVNQFFVIDQKIVYSIENELFVYNFKTNKEELLLKAKNKIENFCINLNKIIIFANDKIEEIEL
jgi:hypothetical protein